MWKIVENCGILWKMRKINIKPFNPKQQYIWLMMQKILNNINNKKIKKIILMNKLNYFNIYN